MEALEKLQQILLDMEIPSDKLDVSIEGNRAWLLRNLKHKNSQHYNYEEAVDLLEDSIR